MIISAQTTALTIHTYKRLLCKEDERSYSSYICIILIKFGLPKVYQYNCWGQGGITTHILHVHVRAQQSCKSYIALSNWKHIYAYLCMIRQFQQHFFVNPGPQMSNVLWHYGGTGKHTSLQDTCSPYNALLRCISHPLFFNIGIIAVKVVRVWHFVQNKNFVFNGKIT